MTKTAYDSFLGRLVKVFYPFFQFGYQHTNTPVSGTLEETTLYSKTIKGNTLGKNGVLRVSAFFTFTSNARSKTLRLYLGSSLFMEKNFANVPNVMIQKLIVNRNSVYEQLSSPLDVFGYSTGTGLEVSGFEDTTQDLELRITSQCGGTTEDIALESVMV